MNTVIIKGKEYPVIYGIQSTVWFASWSGVPIAEMKDFSLQDMTEREVMAVFYGGLVAGSDAKNKRLDITFHEFQELILTDEDLVENLGTLFVNQMTPLVEDAESDAKKKGSQSVLPKSTSRSSRKLASPPRK